MYATVLQCLEQMTALYPRKIAFADYKEDFTFARLTETAKQIGSKIAQQFKPHQPVVIYMEKRAYDVAAFLGVAYAGCFYVPIDSKMPMDRIHLILDTLQPELILYDAVTKKNLEALPTRISKLSIEEAMDADVDETALGRIRSSAKSTDLLYVLFTSGSTGVPKGVTISHGAVLDFMDWICERYNMSEQTSLCNQAPFYFDASVPDLFIPLKIGASTYIPPQTYYTFPKKILQFVREKSINTLIWVPSALCNVVNCRAFEVCVPDCVKLVIFCGEVMPCKHLNVWKKHIPDALYVNMYGPTEATYACMYYDIDRDFADEDKLPLGRACENSEILLLGENNQPADVGQIGEICILGQCLYQGYYGAPEKTAKALVQNPTNTKWIEYMYRTGDLAYVSETGDMVFAGRTDFQIKRLGHRIELGEIESAIMAVDGIDTAACIFRESDSEIIAVYVGDLPENELSALLELKLPHYMLPNSYDRRRSMPMNLNGKIDRAGLKKELAM